MENIVVKIGQEPQPVVVGQHLGLPARLDMVWRKLREARAAESLVGRIETHPILS